MNKKFFAILVSVFAICGMAMIAGSALATVTSVSITSPATTTFYKPQPGSEAAGYLSITVTADTEGQADLYYRIGPESSPVYETPLGAQASLVNGTKPIEQLPFLIPATTTDGLYDVFVKLHQPYGGGGGVWVSATGTNLIGVDGTAPTMSAISFAGKAGTVSGGIWTVDISDITSEALLDTGSMTVSEASTLQSKTVDGVDVSGWGFKTVTLAAGENTGSIKSLLGFTQDVTFNILKVQDTNHDGYLTVVVDLKDASNNTTPVTINIKLDETAPAMTSLTAIIDGSSITGTSTIACEVGCTVSSIKVLLSEPVTVVGTPVVTMGGGSIPAGTPYGTISLDPLDTTNKTLIITPYPGNEKSGLVGDFTFRVAAGAVKDAWGNENAETTFILHVGNAVAPTMSAISFAGKTGTVSGTSWTVDISDITNEALLDTGSMTVSEASTLQSKTVDGTDVSSWCSPVSLVAGENTGSIQELLGFTQDVTFNILKVQDTNHDGYLTVVVELKDLVGNTTSTTINIKLDETAPAMVNLTAIIDSSSITGTTSITCEVGCTVSSIKVLLNEPVTVNGNPVVTIDGLGNYGTISRDDSDTTNKTLIITPYSGNETSGLVGDFTFRVAAGALKDAWGNENAMTTFTLHVYAKDTTAPIVVNVTPTALNETSTGTVTVTITFSEVMDTATDPTVQVIGITSSPIDVTKSSYTGTTWTGTFNFTDNNNEINNAYYAISGAVDAHGNTMAALTTRGENNKLNVDTKAPNAPTVSGLPSAIPIIVDADNISFTVTAEANSLIKIYQGGSVVTSHQLADGATTHEFSVPLLQDAVNQFKVTATDAAGNESPATDLPDITEDSTAPSVTISSTATSPTKTSPIPITVTFSEPVNGFNLTDDVVVTNGTADALAGGLQTFTFNVTPTGDGVVTVKIAAGVAKDYLGKDNTASNEFSIIYGTTTPDTTGGGSSGGGGAIGGQFAPITGTTVTTGEVLGATTEAMTVDDLMAKVIELRAQLEELQRRLLQSTGKVLGAATSNNIPQDFTFKTNLKEGDSLIDVKYLQIILNSDPDTILASSGAGSPGNETTYFGPLTRAAVIKFQEKYASEILAPWNLTTGTGLVGSATRAKLNQLLGR